MNKTYVTESGGLFKLGKTSICDRKGVSMKLLSRFESEWSFIRKGDRASNGFSWLSL